ncbi:ribonuclease P protein component [Actinobaculum massiliense]|uniref:ribonuclease P protein component n=1 Tax=Actinobaculum massiliense TaxID=202789 RepID=UPI000687E3C1|nr:ribonuclease P protein component [Actinobaculum massiliense]MDK8319252.1 ribonuclease P protein component [Actinobaculum massiliense]MDK8566300.1 ribonuclease P protein component [Actinobaculum massiliense]
MLSSDHRIRRSEDFARAFSGVRGNSRRLQVAVGRAYSTTDPHPVRVGFAVSKKVGNSVVRHRIYRQLRHILRSKLDQFGPGDVVVVRAFPAAKGSSSADLERDFDFALDKVREKEARRETLPGRETGTRTETEVRTGEEISS